MPKTIASSGLTHISEILPAVLEAAGIDLAESEVELTETIDGFLLSIPRATVERLAAERDVEKLVYLMRSDDGYRMWFVYRDPVTGDKGILRTEVRPCNHPDLAKALAAEFEMKATEMLRWAETLRESLDGPTLVA